MWERLKINTRSLAVYSAVSIEYAMKIAREEK